MTSDQDMNPADIKELTVVEGITNINVDGARIRILFADGVEASVGRSDLNRSKFNIFFPNPKADSMIAGSFTPSMTGEDVVQMVNKMAAKAAKKN